MPSDVNKPEDSSSEDQRNSSDSQTDNEVSHLDGDIQHMGDKPEVKSIIDRLMNPSNDGNDDAGDDELENHNEDEEAKETDSDADAEDDKKVDEPADDEVEEKKPAKGKAAVVDNDNDKDGDEPEDDAPEETPDDDSESDPDAKELRNYSNDANKRIRQLIAARKKAEAALDAAIAEQVPLKEKAEYRDTLERTLATHKVDTKAWDEWTSLGVLLQSDPGRAAITLGKMAKALGFQDPDGPISKIDDDLQKEIDAREMTKEAAEKIQRQRMQMYQPPAQRQQRDVIEGQTQTQTHSLPRLTRDEVAVANAKGQAAINAVNAEFQKKYPDQWAKLVPEIQAEMATYKGTPPALWGKVARDCAEKVVAKRRAKASVSSRPDQSLRASGGSSSRTATRNNTGPAKSKNELAERLSNGESPRR